MTKNKILNFGDVVEDTDTGTYYVAINGTTSVDKKKLFVLCLEVNDKFDCLQRAPIPFNRATLRNFKFHANIEARIIPYLNALNIKHVVASVNAHSFNIKN